ncbi:MAG: hypothetical protein IJU58_00090 [Clostridia bacterium]|nr:hypothetical protein [Clostridia bacterium]
MIKEILEYQKLDAKLVSIEKEIANSPAKQTANKMVEYVKAAQQTLVGLEQNASQLIAEYEKLNAQYQTISKQVEKLTKQKYENFNEDQLRENANIVAQMNGVILNIERSISVLSEKISKIMRDFDKTKEQAKTAKMKFEQNKNEYNKLVATKQADIEKLKQDLIRVEKTVNKDMLKKYKDLRGDNKFPIFVPLVNESCGGCMMNMPRARLDKLKADKILECENCHRMIYLPEDKDK